MHSYMVKFKVDFSVHTTIKRRLLGDTYQKRYTTNISQHTLSMLCREMDIK